MCVLVCVGGGYVISPVNHGRQSAVKHMLAIDWNFWKVYVFTSSAKYVTINMLGRIAGNLLNYIFFSSFLTVKWERGKTLFCILCIFLLQHLGNYSKPN